MPRTNAAAAPRKMSEKNDEPVTTPLPTLVVILVMLLAESDPYSDALPPICAPKTRTRAKPMIATMDATMIDTTAFVLDNFHSFTTREVSKFPSLMEINNYRYDPDKAKLSITEGRFMDSIGIVQDETPYVPSRKGQPYRRRKRQRKPGNLEQYVEDAYLERIDAQHGKLEDEEIDGIIEEEIDTV